VKRLIAARFAHVVPKLADIGGHAGKVEILHGNAFAVSWQIKDEGKLTLAANLADTPAELSLAPFGTPFFAHPLDAGASLAQGTLPPWAVVASLTARE